MIPVKASGWLNSGLTEDEKKILIQSGLVPVNDVFFPVWENTKPINLFYGGYGSGKSQFIQTLLLHKCRSEKYFKCYFGRKVFDDVRGSVHSKFVSLIEELNLAHEFKFSKEPNGSMVITHRNGNKFIPYGAKDANQLKSIDDPTHFFLEEMDHFTLEDFGIILSRLRTMKADTQLFAAFNTAKVYPGHWILKTFFPDKNESPSEEEKRMTDQVEKSGVLKIFCNYVDNYFIDHEDYYNKLALAACGDEAALKASAEGAWGSQKAVNPFATSFIYNKHVSSELKLKKELPLFVSIDFNLNPFACTGRHIYQDSQGLHYHVVDEFDIKQGSISAMISELKLRYAQWFATITITGDYSGSRRDIGQTDNASYYDQIQRALGLRSSQIKLYPNPLHSNSRADVNYVLHNFPDFKIAAHCKNTIFDYQNVECDAFGSIIKRDRGDLSQRADYIDTDRYAINAFLHDWIKKNRL